MNEWISVAEKLPPENKIVETRIDDGKYIRNEQELKRRGNFWYLPDGSMYVYYTPTHWRDSPLNEFPERLRRMRESMRPVRSMTVTSQLMGLHPDMLRRYERGEVEPSMDALYKIADYYGVSTDYLLGRTNFPFVHRI